ncbi:MAG: amidase [Acidimicrobiia bacterium]|nr:amidase [Acidimicrobiia bacterium]
MDLLDEAPTAIGAAVRHGETRATEVVAAALDRISERDTPIGAFVVVDAEQALAAADRVDRALAAGDDPGPLAGVPLAVKDLEDAAGFVTTYGSALHRDDPPATDDSTLVRRLTAAGAVVVGKTATPEFGHMGDTVSPVSGTTSNPWALDRSPGGSSGGSAAALATGMVPLATGSDGGGSIRIPAAACGLAGFKPTHGRIPLGPAAPNAGPLSTSGPMTRRTNDLVDVLALCVGPDPADPFSLPPPQTPWNDLLDGLAPPARVLWAPDWGYAVDAAVRQVTGAAVERLADAGTEVIPVDAVVDEDPVVPWYLLWTTLMYRRLRAVMDTPAWDQVTPGLRILCEQGAQVSAAEVLEAQDAVWRLNAQLAALFDTAPLLLCPTLAGRLPRSGKDGTIDGEFTPMWVRFTYPFNLTRHPAGSVYAGSDPEGMPVGLQVIGPHLADAAVLRTMAVLDGLVGPPPWEQTAVR